MKKNRLLKFNKQRIASLAKKDRLIGGAIPDPDPNPTNWSCIPGTCNTVTTGPTTTNGTGANCVSEFAECNNFGDNTEILCYG